MADPFPTTQWSLVLAAQRDGSSAAPALASLCEAYWFPIYTYVRRRAGSPDDARDLVQEFFLQFLEKRHIDIAQPGAGRFRMFLLHKVKQFLARERERHQTQKRGAGMQALRLDTERAEHRYAAALIDTRTPEIEYEMHWATTLVDRTMHRLGEEARARGRSKEFVALKSFLSEGTRAVPYRQAGAALGITESAVRSAVHRLRRRFAHLLREEIGETVAGPAEVDDELRHLFAVLS